MLIIRNCRLVESTVSSSLFLLLLLFRSYKMTKNTLFFLRFISCPNKQKKLKELYLLTVCYQLYIVYNTCTVIDHGRKLNNEHHLGHTCTLLCYFGVTKKVLHVDDDNNNHHHKDNKQML